MILQSALYTSPNLWNLFDSVESIDTPDKLKPDGCLLLHGGEDISPSIYNHKNSVYCRASKTPSWRDQIEMAFINRAQELNIPIIGICRGAQLLCAVDGGHLVQHIVGHAQNGHVVVSGEFGVLGESNTAHHQMMVPRVSRSNVTIGWVEENLYGYEQEDKLREYDHCPEIVYFGKYHALGIQGHPEWLSNENEFMQRLSRVVKQYLME